MKCLIVDDERLAGELIAEYISKIPDLELVGIKNNAIAAKSVLTAQEIDILFLDIHMPDLTGLDLLRILKNPPATILTTAYSEYAVESYQLDVVDYLVKPIEFDRFFQAVSKAIEKVAWQKGKQKAPIPNLKKQMSTAPPKDFFFIKADTKIFKINYKDVLYIESLREYVRLHTSEQRIVARLSMSHLVATLPKQQFVRIHRTYIINIQHINNIEGNMVRIAGQRLPISKGKREEFLALIEEQGLL